MLERIPKEELVLPNWNGHLIKKYLSRYFSVAYAFGLWLAIADVINIMDMKRLVKGATEFVKREWFLLVALTAITIIILLFEVL